MRHRLTPISSSTAAPGLWERKFDSSASALTVAEDVKLQVTDLDSRKVDEHYNGELKQHDGEAVIMTQLGYSDLNVA